MLALAPHLLSASVGSVCLKPLAAVGRALRYTVPIEKSSVEIAPQNINSLSLEMAEEGIARMEALEKILDSSTDEVGTPWRWELQLRRNEMMRRSFIALDKELKNQGRPLVQMPPKERTEAAQTAVDSVLGPYRTRPNSLILAIGLGVPIGLTYSILFLPEAIRPAGFGIANLFSGPFSFGLTYWLNGKLKPLSGVKQRTNGEEKTPVQLHMERIGANSTGLSDPFKDGRNISKDAAIALRDSLNDAAWNIKDERDATQSLAITILHHAVAFPEVKIDSLSSYLLHLKLKSRFGNAKSLREVKDLVTSFAAKEGLSESDAERALALVDRLMRPDLWSADQDPMSESEDGIKH